MAAFLRGSEWRKWDLHIHSSASDGHSSPSQIVEKAIEKGLSVIAVTDHHTAKNIDAAKEIGRRNGLTVISGIEFRTEYGARSVHMIGLFPDNYHGTDLTSTALHELVLAPLDLSETSIIAKGKECNSTLNSEEAFKEGMFRVQVDFKRAADLIHKYGGIVTVHAGNKSNSIEEMKHDGPGATNVGLLEDSLGTVKEELMKTYIDICEVNRCSESEFYLKFFGRPSIAASDAHTLNEIGQKFSWIKANPSFDGLLQIKYEPDTRVRIQEEHPDIKSSYTVIDYVEISHPDFSESGSPTRIYFNENLNCIIGGKSTGKSLLLNNMAYVIDKDQVISKYEKTRPERKKKSDEDLFKPINGFSVHWADGSISPSTKDKKKIVYIPQTYLNRLSDEREETTEVDELIKEILIQNKEYKNRFDNCQLDIEKQKKNSDKLIYDYVETANSISALRTQLLSNNGSETISKEIKKLEDERKAYASGILISDEQSRDYSKWLEELQALTDEESDLQNDRVMLINSGEILLQKPYELDQARSSVRILINESILDIQSEVNKIWDEKKVQLIKAIDIKLSEISTRSEELKKLISEIRPIIETNASYAAVSDKIAKERGKLQDALKTESEISKLEQMEQDVLTELSKNVTKYHDTMYAFSKYVNENRSLKVEGLEFKVEVVLRVEALKGRLHEILNNKSFSRFRHYSIGKYDETCYTEEGIRQLINSIQDNNTSSLELKSQYAFENVLRELLSNWYNFDYIVTMDNDEFELMSPGKKALVLLKLLIGMAESDCPMLIDQPEDDLDNRSIYDELVKYMKEKKIERQMIVVTHNANIVVGSDSEEVVVANQDGQNTPNELYKFEYVSGSVEDNWISSDEYTLQKQGIQVHICEVLEGGKNALNKRYDKYCFMKNPTNSQ